MHSRSLRTASRCRHHRPGASGPCPPRHGFGGAAVGAGKTLLVRDPCLAAFLLVREPCPASRIVSLPGPDTQTLLAASI